MEDFAGTPEIFHPNARAFDIALQEHRESQVKDEFDQFHLTIHWNAATSSVHTLMQGESMETSFTPKECSNAAVV
ncbi:MAG: hypothetical protein ACLPXT_02240 [Terracidiphilus sp.]